MTKRHFKPTEKVAIRPSPQKGRGVFATRAIRRGEIIETAPVLLVPDDEGDDLLSSFLGHYMFQTDDGRHYAIGLGLTSLINHAERANAEFYVNRERITIKATRSIAAGDEVTINYGWSKADWRDAIGALPITEPPNRSSTRR